MSDTRIDPLEPPYGPKVAAIFKAIMPPGQDPLLLFRTIAHSQRVLERLHAGNLLDRGSITLREREIVIDRTTARCGSAYEWGVHIAYFGEKAGLSPEQVRATAVGTADDPAWNERDSVLIRLVDELHDMGRIGEEVFDGLRRYWDAAQIIELIALVGFYHAISFLTNGLEVAMEPWAAAFPRD